MNSEYVRMWRETALIISKYYYENAGKKEEKSRNYLEIRYIVWECTDNEYSCGRAAE